MDGWDQFPDAPAANPAQATQPPQAASPWDQFPDAEPVRKKGRSLDVQADGSLVPTRSDYGPKDQGQMDQWIQAGKNVAQAGAEAATGVTGAVAGDVAGLGALAYDTAANAVLHPLSGSQPSQYADPAAVRERVSNALTYRAEDPNNLTRKITQAPGRVVSGAGDFLASQAEKTGIPYLEHFARALPQAAAGYLGVKAGAPLTSREGVALPRQIDTRPAPAAVATPEQVAVKTATDAGYKLTPTQVGNKVGGTAEGLSGQAALERQISKQNVTITDNLSKKALGITEDKPLNSATLGGERAKANRAYAEVAKTGKRKTSDDYRQEISQVDDRSGAESFAGDSNPAVSRLKEVYGNTREFDAAHAVAKIRQLRSDARANIKTRDPDKMAVGHAQQKIADALDNELARHVDDIGRPELAANYKAARVKLAKLNTVEQALTGTNVSAKKIWQQWKRGAPLEGELLAIARTYDSFSHVLQEAAKIRQKHPFSVVDAFVAAGAAGASSNPLLLGAVAARPLTRAALASDFYQKNFVAPKGGSSAVPKASRPINPKVGAPAVAVRDERRAR